MHGSLSSTLLPEITSECPCVGHCSTVLGDDVCRSCLRTFDEVTRWLEMSEVERVQVNRRIALHTATPPNLPLSGEEPASWPPPDKGELEGV